MITEIKEMKKMKGHHANTDMKEAKRRDTCYAVRSAQKPGTRYEVPFCDHTQNKSNTFNKMKEHEKSNRCP